MSYNMHRVAVGKKSDWEGVPYERMNRWQQRAYDTNGLDTPGNRVTLGRLLLGAASLVAIKRGYKKTGMIGLAVSLLGDWVDGRVADATDTKMKRNGDLDAGVDMLMRAGALAVLSSEGLVDRTYATTIAATNAATAVITGIKMVRGQQTASSLAGKTKTVAEGASLVASGINRLSVREIPVMERLEDVTVVAAIAGNILATAGYAEELFTSAATQNPQSPPLPTD